MRFNTHSDVAGRHAFLSASKHHWVNYDDEKLARVFKTALAAQRGTDLHNLAREAIRLGVKLPRTTRTLNCYVNDAIGYRMSPEVVLFYSDNAFGTADTISFRQEMLRIHDLKTGVVPASFHQLEIYAAFFCLEYGVKPGEIAMELRIYQNDDISIHTPEVDDIAHIMDRVITFDKYINQMRQEAFA